MVRGKFQLVESKQHHYNKDARTLVFNAVYKGDKEDSENTYYHEATPSGRIEMTVNNQAALKQFELGRYYYVDFHFVD